jgi:two-component system sensor histidine kinase RegB
MTIRDYGVGIATHLLQTLGSNMVKSPKGMGIAVLLSHTSFERLGGKLYLKPHSECGTEAIVTLPLSV